ncbi:uncharacterized protein LOC5506731 [Nematostella vectensis]|uniref:uncharacterized protein LOC5506731 n=1 Tax=Nematostella vectensis TaxID=45351 RepID=UPI00139011EF|nr:uncharacterized protein LOC5506731 [Nematostella vectensis]
MGVACAKCCLCYCIRFFECPGGICRCPQGARSCCGEFCQCADCCDVTDDDEIIVLGEIQSKLGEASYTHDNGDTYTGQWQAGMRHGKGELVTADGRRIEGYWRNDEYVGTEPPP